MTMTTAALLARARGGVVGELDPMAGEAAIGRRRRSFTAEYKSRIVDEYDALPARSPERSALVRREALSTSHVSEWRKTRDARARDGLVPKPRARRSAEQAELEKLRHRNERLVAELAKAKEALEITGKAHALLEQLSESADCDPKSTP
jgi:hypothetical protein